MSPRRTNPGFTLIEILASLAFVGVLLPVVLSALMLSSRAGEIAERSAIAAQLGENLLGEMIAEKTWSSSGSRGDFGQDWPGYRWQLTQTNTTMGQAPMTELTLDVYFPVQGHEQSVQLATLASQTDPTQ